MSFKDKTFEQRFNDPMWHHSEDKFEQRWEHKYDRFGLDLDDSDISTWSLDPFIRHSPDYICQIGERTPVFFMEVQGTGSRTPGHKFKFQKLEKLTEWNKLHDVWLWLWDNHNDQEDIISLNTVRLLIAQGKATQGSFDGKRPYWELPVGLVREASDWDVSRYG